MARAGIPWAGVLIRRGWVSGLLALLVAGAEIVGPRVPAWLGAAPPDPPWKEPAGLPYLTLGIAVPLLAATALALLPGRLAKLAACAVHAWILLLALLCALAGVAALVTIILIVPAIALLLTAAAFGANSAAFIVLALRDVTEASRRGRG